MGHKAARIQCLWDTSAGGDIWKVVEARPAKRRVVARVLFLIKDSP